MTEPTRTTWWQRNRTWALPVGCVVLFIFGTCFAGLGFVGLGVYKTYSWGKKEMAPLVQRAEAEAKSHPIVVAKLGAPIESGTITNFQFRSDNGESVANFVVPLKGSKASGTLQVQAKRSDGNDWDFSELVLRANGEDPIELLPEGR